jgi:hypothetical protein
MFSKSRKPYIYILVRLKTTEGETISENLQPIFIEEARILGL